MKNMVLGSHRGAWRKGRLSSLTHSVLLHPGLEGQRLSGILAEVKHPALEPRNEGYHNSPWEMDPLLPSHAQFTDEETGVPAGGGICPRSPHPR